MAKRIHRLVAALVSGAIVLGGTTLAASPASFASSASDVLGTARPSTFTGTKTSTFSVLTSGLCPSPPQSPAGTPYLTAYISGPSFAEGGTWMFNYPQSGATSGDGYLIPNLEGNSLVDIAFMNADNLTPTFEGTYTITVKCLILDMGSGDSTPYGGEFVGEILFTDSTNWVALGVGVGGASITPSSGTNTSALTLTTTGTCPVGNQVRVRVTGTGFPQDGYVMKDTVLASTVTSGSGYSMTLSSTMAQAMAAQSSPVSLTGLYDLKLECLLDGVGEVISQTAATIYFTSPTAYRNSVNTTTAVALSASSVPAGDEVTMTATVTPNDVAGSVEFFTKLGDAAAVSRGQATVSGGTASRTLSTTGLEGRSARSYNVYAVFTPTDDVMRPSTSANRSLSITVGTATTTTLVLGSTAVVDDGTDLEDEGIRTDDLKMTVTVSPSSAQGSITFYAKVGSGQPVVISSERELVSGSVMVNQPVRRWNLTVGLPGVAKVYKVYAVFTPENGQWRSSTSAEKTVSVTAPVTPAATVKPSFSATPQVGEVLSCKIGTWTGADTFAVAIKVGSSVKASRAKGTSTAALTYTPVAGDVGASATCEVTAYNATFSTEKKVTSTAVTVLRGDISPTKKPTVSGTVKVGKTVTVDTGRWPNGTTIKVQWVTVDGRQVKEIAGATDVKLTILGTLRDKVLAVIVTATAPGRLGTAQVTAGLVK